jgi:hypothetical protein
MSALLDFLNEMFGKNSGATVEDLKNHFSADFGGRIDFCWCEFSANSRLF